MIHLLAMCLSLFVLVIPSIILYKLCWIPLRLQRLVEIQGIRGPPYRFFHGTTKEIIKMKQQTNDAVDMSLLDHDIFPIIQPHFYSWIKVYGKSSFFPIIWLYRHISSVNNWNRNQFPSLDWHWAWTCYYWAWADQRNPQQQRWYI